MQDKIITIAGGSQSALLDASLVDPTELRRTPAELASSILAVFGAAVSIVFDDSEMYVWEAASEATADKDALGALDNTLVAWLDGASNEAAQVKVADASTKSKPVQTVGNVVPYGVSSTGYDALPANSLSKATFKFAEPKIPTFSLTQIVREMWDDGIKHMEEVSQNGGFPIMQISQANGVVTLFDHGSNLDNIDLATTGNSGLVVANAVGHFTFADVPETGASSSNLAFE